MAANTAVVQWNCRGIKNKKTELQLLADETGAACIGLQETKLPEDGEINISGYKSYLHNLVTEEGENAHGGVGLLVKQSISQVPLELDTACQAVAVSVKLHKRVTICSVYFPPGNENEFSLRILEDLIDQFTEPFLLIGDFNAFHRMWGCDRTCGRGSILEDFLGRNDIQLLDGDEATHFSSGYGSFSHIDLSICSNSLFEDFQWEVNEDLMDSDHFPILIKTREKFVKGARERWVMQKADWAAFQALTWDKEGWGVLGSTEERAEFITTSIIDAAKQAIPKSSGKGGPRCAVWFDLVCKNAKRERRQAANALKKKNKANKNKKDKDKFNIQERIELKRASAKARLIFKRARKQSWLDFISGINNESTVVEVWRRINLLNHTYKPASVASLKVGNRIIDDEKEIADAIAQQFASVSSLTSCNEDFLSYKAENEVELDFSTDETLEYNLPFTMWEMESAINEAKDSSPGPDEVHFRMIKNLLKESKSVLLDFYNKLYSDGEIPQNWRMAYVIPLLKEGKDPLLASSYRPISLTSCLCKIYERMLYKRLGWKTGRLNAINAAQNGYCQGKSTIDGLVALETDIHDAFVSKNVLVNVFVDLEKAFDTTWRFLILRELHRMGLRGKLPKAIVAFLKERKFRVWIGRQLSEAHSLEMGVPQGGVLSGFLFIIALNVVINDIRWGSVKKSVYVDDLRMSVAARSVQAATSLIQPVLDQLAECMNRTGFRIALTQDKTVVMVFRKHLHGEPPIPVLHIGGKQLTVVQQKKFLGLIFDTKLDWVPHIEYLRTWCLRTMSILKVIASKNPRVDRDMLLRVYRALIRSKLDYGCQVYGTASKSVLAKLDTVHHQGLRICLGAFRTSPVLSLYAEAYEPCLSDRRSMLMLQLAARMRRLPTDRASIRLLDSRLDPVYASFPGKTKSFRLAVRLLADKVGLIFPNIPLLNAPLTPPWGIRKPNICFAMSVHSKAQCLDEQLRQMFLGHGHEESISIFTDGSKSHNSVGCGVVRLYKGSRPPHCVGRKLNSVASVFTSELYAIKIALTLILGETRKSVCIYSDSSSALMALAVFGSKIPLVQEIHQLLHRLRMEYIVVDFCWVPAHVGINGNELADREAKAACKRAALSTQEIPLGDVKAVIKSIIYGEWMRRWVDKIGLDGNPWPRPVKLRDIQYVIEKSSAVVGLDRRDATKFTRLRIGHTHLTHSHFFEEDEQNRDPLICIDDDVVMSIEHMLINCRRFQPERRLIFHPGEFEGNLRLCDLLGRNDIEMKRKVLMFFKEIGFYKEI